MREEAGAEGEVSETISWMARRSLSRCSGLLIPISRWISVSDKLAMMAPLLTLARQAATYHAGMPTHSWTREGSGRETTRGRGETETISEEKPERWRETERKRRRQRDGESKGGERDMESSQKAETDRASQRVMRVRGNVGRQKKRVGEG